MSEKKKQNKGYYSKSKISVEETKTSRKITMEVPENETHDVTAGLMKINHQRGLYDDFFTLNQQFMLYVLTIGLRGRDWEVFIWFLARMDYGNKILINQELLQKELKMSQPQVSKALEKLRENKIIIETKYNTAKYEISFNYNIMNPQMAFKGKATKHNIEVHKDSITNNTPYQKNYNIEGNIDLVNGSTGEVFNTIILPESQKVRSKEIIESPQILEEWQLEVQKELKEEQEQLLLEIKQKEAYKKELKESGFLNFE